MRGMERSPDLVREGKLRRGCRYLGVLLKAWYLHVGRRLRTRG